jgi:hypothetical protein
MAEFGRAKLPRRRGRMLRRLTDPSLEMEMNPDPPDGDEDPDPTDPAGP